MERTITIQEAYNAMYAYLEEYYRLTHADEVGAMLGGMSTLCDGGTADPGVWADWLSAIEKATTANVDTALRLERPKGDENVS